jgi:hypothetical protein
VTQYKGEDFGDLCANNFVHLKVTEFVLPANVPALWVSDAADVSMIHWVGIIKCMFGFVSLPAPAFARSNLRRI